MRSGHKNGILYVIKLLVMILKLVDFNFGGMALTI